MGWCRISQLRTAFLPTGARDLISGGSGLIKGRAEPGQPFNRLSPGRKPVATIIFLLLATWLPAQADLIWPTPNPAFQRGEPIDAFVQPTVSGRVESGLFGCVRNDGRRFHEGLDLYPLRRDQRGEAVDPIYAVLPGRVVHVNSVAGRSSYGRYVVVEHDGEVPAYHTLYAHLARVAGGIAPGARVEAGTVLGTMGRSASYAIPKSRAHLHFEIGFRLTDDFQDWFDRQRFGSPNYHGLWNGMNLVSVDPLDFYQSMRSGQTENLFDYLRQLPVVARIRVHSGQVPSFVRNFPALVTRPYAGRAVVAWDIAFTQYGLPKAWTPRFAEEGLSGQPGNVKLIAYNPALLESQTCREVVTMSGSTPSISAGTVRTIRKLFGFH
jgi:murein DD-endopeptidase MepM/ murein hydrolase activator NlpD